MPDGICHNEGMTTAPAPPKTTNPATAARPDPAEVASRLYRYDRPCVPLPSPEAVGDAAVEAFHRDGFVAVENVFSPAEVAGYLDAIRAAVDADGTPEGPGRGVIGYEGNVDGTAMTGDARQLAVRKLQGFWNTVPGLRAAGEHPILTGLCERLLGEPVSMFQDMALLKPPGGGVEKPWHQDTAYFALTTPLGVIGTWTALDSATTENGCMHVIPGSHKLGPTPHYHDRDCQIPDDAVDVANDVVVPLRPGGVLFFSGLVHHGTPPNLSEHRRRALQFHYLGESGVRAESWEEHGEHFRDDAGPAVCTGAKWNRPPRTVASRAEGKRLFPF